MFRKAVTPYDLQKSLESPYFLWSKRPVRYEYWAYDGLVENTVNKIRQLTAQYPKDSSFCACCHDIKDFNIMKKRIEEITQSQINLIGEIGDRISIMDDMRKFDNLGYGLYNIHKMTLVLTIEIVQDKLLPSIKKAPIVQKPDTPRLERQIKLEVKEEEHPD